MSPLHAIAPRRLAAISTAVLLLHLALLEFAPATFSFDEPLQTKPFLTRSVVRASQAPVPAVPATPAVLAKLSPAPAVARLHPLTPVAAPQPSAPEAAASQAAAETVHPVPVVVAAAATATPVAGPAPAEPAAASPALPLPAAAQGAVSAAQAGSELPQRPPVLRVPASARLKYRVLGEFRGLPQTATAELHWQHDGHGYEARLSVGVLLRSRVQTSRGSIGQDGLMPERFSDKSGSERAAHFVRAPGGQTGQVIFSANTPGVALSAGAQDRLSVLLQLAALLAGEPARYSGGVTLQVVGARESDIWVFKVEGSETLELPYGRLASLKLTRSPRREYEQKVEVWLGTEMGYLPVRVRITEPNGNFLDQQLSSLDTP